jgi:hypothetical protein
MSKPNAQATQAPNVVDLDRQRRKQHGKRLYDWTFKQITRDPHLSPAEKVVGIVIASHINWKTSEAFPSTQTIAAEAGVSERKVIDAIRVLAAAGHLTVKAGKGGRKHPNHYRLALKNHADRDEETLNSVQGFETGNTELFGKKTLNSVQENNLGENNSAPNGARTESVEIENIMQCFPSCTGSQGKRLRAALNAALSRGMKQDQIWKLCDHEELAPADALIANLQRAGYRTGATMGSS